MDIKQWQELYVSSRKYTGQNSNIRLMGYLVQGLRLSVTGPQGKKSTKHLCNVKIKTETISPYT